MVTFCFYEQNKKIQKLIESAVISLCQCSEFYNISIFLLRLILKENNISLNLTDLNS